MLQQIDAAFAMRRTGREAIPPGAHPPASRLLAVRVRRAEKSGANPLAP